MQTIANRNINFQIYLPLTASNQMLKRGNIEYLEKFEIFYNFTKLSAVWLQLKQEKKLTLILYCKFYWVFL